MDFPSDSTSPPVNTNLPDENFFLAPQMTLCMAIFLSISKHKNLETTSPEMIIDVFITRHLTTSSSGTSYIGEESTPYSVLKYCHNSACGVHLSGLSTSHKIICAGYFWPTLFYDYIHVMKRYDNF
jgi:hypothetical protein